MNTNWSYGPETAKWGHDLCGLDLWPLTLTFCMDVTSVDGNYSWKFQDDTMTGTLSKRCDRRTDRRTSLSMNKLTWCKSGRVSRRTDGRTDGQSEISVLRAAWSQLNIANVLIILENCENVSILRKNGCVIMGSMAIRKCITEYMGIWCEVWTSIFLVSLQAHKRHYISHLRGNLCSDFCKYSWEKWLGYTEI